MADMTALQAYALSQSSTFQHRLSILLDVEAMAVLRNTPGTLKSALAKNVVFSPDAYAATLGRELVFDTNLIAAGFSTDEAGNPVDSLASDAAIRSQIATNWTAWSDAP